MDETLGQLLVAEGFSTIEEISKASSEDISKIEAIDENTAKELKERAANHLKKIYQENLIKLKSLGLDKYLLKNKSLTIKETEAFYNMIGDSFLEFDQAFNNST